MASSSNNIAANAGVWADHRRAHDGQCGHRSRPFSDEEEFTFNVQGYAVSVLVIVPRVW
jgi:hypothetical protein